MFSRRNLWTVGFLLIVAAYGFGFYRQLPANGDFHDELRAYYIPAAEMLQGKNAYLIHVPGVLTPADTPTWYLCFEPLAALSPYAAAWTWFWINVAALALLLCLLIREAGFRGNQALVVAGICLMYPPLATNFWFGQSEIFLGLLLALMLVALRRRRDGLAGLSLGAAALLRAYPIGLIAYLFVLRRWNAILWTAIGAAVGGLITILFLGWPVIDSYIHLIGVGRGAGLVGLAPTLDEPTGLMKHPANLNLGQFVKWLYDRTASRPIPAAVSVLAGLSELAAVAICISATVGIDPDDPDWRGFGLWIVTLSLISPVSWYFFLCCFLPLIIGMAAAWRRGELAPAALYAIVAAYLVGTLIPSYGHPLFPLLSALTADLPRSHPHLDHALSEKEFAAFMLTWLAAYLFARARKPAPRATTGAQALSPRAPFGAGR